MLLVNMMGSKWGRKQWSTESETEIENKRENRAISCTFSKALSKDAWTTIPTSLQAELLRAGVTEAASALFYFQFNDVSLQSSPWTRPVSIWLSVCLSLCLIGGASFATNFVAVANENENAAECSPIPASYDTGGTTSTSVVHQL